MVTLSFTILTFMYPFSILFLLQAPLYFINKFLVNLSCTRYQNTSKYVSLKKNMPIEYIWLKCGLYSSTDPLRINTLVIFFVRSIKILKAGIQIDFVLLAKRD